MSSGHHTHEHFHLGEREVDEVLKNPRIQARLARKPKISFAFDIPYLAGYSKDGGTIYIDRHLPARALPVNGKKINVLRFLVIHETVEKAIIDAMHRTYQYSHEVASRAEDRAVRSSGLDPKKYNEALHPYIKADEREKLKVVPKDLDLTPYIDSHDFSLVKHLKEKMG